MKENLRNIIETKNIDAILITDPFNLRYYTGFRGGEGIAVVTKSNAYLMTDSRYTEAATKESDFEVREFNAKNPLKSILNDIIDKDTIQTTGFEDLSISYDSYRNYKKIFEGTDNASEENKGQMIPLGDELLLPRQIKTAEEIELLRTAEHIGDMAFKDILGILKPGMTELEVAAELEYSMKKHGAEGLSFDTIAASGINSSMPHAIPSQKKLEAGDFLTMDFGCIYEGYCSDMTRTVVIGKADDEMKKVYNTVLKAQTEAIAAVKAGLVCKDVDKIARDIIAAEGYGQYFGHGLGHSVGLYIHESPALNTRDETVLEAGMIETVEPGIYIPGRWGVRIEDMGAVTAEGYDDFTGSAKELIEL